MSVASASAFLFAASLKNRLRKQVQRLRQPKYLIATAVGGFYFYSLFVRRLFFRGPTTPMEEGTTLLLEVPLMALAVLTLVGTWVIGTPAWALAFSEAEVQFLFPGPVSRRTLLQFRVAKTLMRTAFSAALMALLSSGVVTGNGWMYFLGLWLALATMSLHSTGAALVQFSWIQRGGFRWMTRVLIAVALLAIFGLSIQSALAAEPLPAKWTTESLSNWVQALLGSAPLAWLLWPIRAPLQLALARELPTFLAALPAALAIFAVHYLWVVTRASAFEEAALKGTEARGEARNLATPTRVLPGATQKRPPFRLGSLGRPEVALLWKNAVGLRRLGSARGLAGVFVMVAVALGASVVFSPRGSSGPIWTTAAMLSAMAAGMLTVFGATSIRADFRQDLDHLDVLRATPLAGWQLVLGQVSAPLVVLVAYQWVALGFTLFCVWMAPPLALPTEFLLPGAVAFAVVGPGLIGGALLIQNAIALLFPDWANVDPQQRGLDVVGQRLLAFIGSWLVLLVGVLPAALVGGLIAATIWFGLQSAWALAAGGLFASAALAIEFAAGVALLGGIVDRLDPTA